MSEARGNGRRSEEKHRRTHCFTLKINRMSTGEISTNGLLQFVFGKEFLSAFGKNMWGNWRIGPNLRVLCIFSSAAPIPHPLSLLIAISPPPSELRKFKLHLAAFARSGREWGFVIA